MSNPNTAKGFNNAGAEGNQGAENLMDIFRVINVAELKLDRKIRTMRANHNDLDEAGDYARETAVAALKVFEDIDALVRLMDERIAINAANKIRTFYEYLTACAMDASGRMGLKVGHRFNQTDPSLIQDADLLDKVLKLKKSGINNLAKAINSDRRVHEFLEESARDLDDSTLGAERYEKKHVHELRNVPALIVGM